MMTFETQGIPVEPPTPQDEEVVSLEPPSPFRLLQANFASMAELLKEEWHDPRFGLRLAIGFLEQLQNPDLTLDEAAKLDVISVKPYERL